ncbi:inositol-pentakisphosphate 2-kinase [Aspergillus coremiiformis]|uniref:Inositol-pentakisphosphate 2-kinase n=1 Tax=Aspergillus coremiiformis TaxID=138285 RepID=A0A5N6Z2R4_9EURO|nr:inositol-pentakisphosphate 2-kinase [Aspergillus coremiiformis]
MTKPSLLELPVGTQLLYLAEGGANIVYRIVSTKPAIASKKEIPFAANGAVPGVMESCSVPSEFKGKLLRLRKDTKSGIPYQEIARNFDKNIRPLFKPEELVDQELVYLPRGLVQHYNDQLRAAELNGKRPTRRQGVYLSPAEPFGLLITDMTTFNDPGTTLAELKPKWLLQSPSAPATARRCRTCALRDMKNHESWRTGGKQERSFCPLDLVSEKFENVLRATRSVKGCKDPKRLAKLLYWNGTIQKLLAHQKAHQDVGLHGPPAQSWDKSLAMTLRDCTMFIKMPRDDTGSVEIRLGDLDLKTGAGGKAQYWLDLEKQLVSEGWYSGSKSSSHASDCALQGSRGHFQPSI